MQNSEQFNQAKRLIENAGSIFLTSHVRPDGDSVGSMQALVEIISYLGKKAKPFLLSPLAEWYNFLFDEPVKIVGRENDITPQQLHNMLVEECDLLIICDTNSNVQLPKLNDILKGFPKPVLVIDHHVTGDHLGTVEVLDNEAAATGEIVYDLIKHADWPVSRRTAEALFVALSTDTGWFRFGSADSRLYRTAAELIEAGADPNKLYQQLYQNFSEARMKLLALVLDRIKLHFDGRVATQYLMREDFDRTGANGRDTENMIDECQRIGSVEAAAMFIELSDGGFRCSLRSKGSVDVRKIAQANGGGGHTMAAGVNLPGPIDNARNIVLEAVREQLVENS